MRKWKQGLASLLAVMMLVSALPATALAAEEETGQQEPILTLEEPTVEGNTPAEEEPTVEGDAPAEEEPTVEEDTPAEEEPTVEEDTSAEEEVVYNLLNCPVTVGSDETRAEEYAYAPSLWRTTPSSPMRCSSPMTGKPGRNGSWTRRTRWMWGAMSSPLPRNRPIRLF